MALGIITIVSLSCYTGILIFATFHQCDPIATKVTERRLAARHFLSPTLLPATPIAFQQIRKADQLLPFFVMELAESVPGLPGLFVAGVFSAALRYVRPCLPAKPIRALTPLTRAAPCPPA